ncbi:MAG TPA: hypothetical protein VGX51_01645 [Solirubrobacteraceae bacterium]|nr:hypothetical protein [Solirubrobacteraceae bacterium]
MLFAPSARAEQIWPECVSGSAPGECRESGWYTTPVSVIWKSTGAPQHTEPCELGRQYRYESDTVAKLSCEAEWQGGGTDRKTIVLHDEVSELATEAVPERPPDSNGWYNHPVAITFAGRGFSGPAACSATGPSPTVSYSGPDTLSTAIGARCVDPAGKSANASFGLRYDATPPSLTDALPTRAPDFNGLYNHPVRFVFTGTDAMSGMEPCSATYAGPDSETAELTGVCHDRAGNAATLTVTFRYHATPPALSFTASPGDGVVSLRWSASTSVAITRSPGLHGPHASLLYEGRSGSFTDTRSRDGVRYAYTISAKDIAGNVTRRTISVTPDPRLIAPAPNARVTGPPLLRWTPVRGASFYNVQLFRGAKLLSTWPSRASLQLSNAWRYQSAEYRLVPGRYTWYVWPGFGSVGAAHYGALIGHRTFVVRPTVLAGAPL